MKSANLLHKQGFGDSQSNSTVFRHYCFTIAIQACRSIFEVAVALDFAPEQLNNLDNGF